MLLVRGGLKQINLKVSVWPIANSQNVSDTVDVLKISGSSPVLFGFEY